MAKRRLARGQTDVSLDLFIQDSSVTTGAGLTGLTFESANLVAYYHQPQAVPASIGLVTQTVTASHVDGGFVELGSASMPGWYRFDLPDAVCASAASGLDYVGVQLSGAASMVPVNVELELEDYWEGKAVAGTLSTTDMTTDLPVTDDDHYIGRIIIWKTGTLSGQATDVTDSASANGELTFTAVTVAPTAGDKFRIY